MKKDGGPAFPRPAFAPHDVGYEDCGIHDSQEGMTLRDYFAAAALTGLLATDRSGLLAADEAYKFADAMLAARSAGGEE